MASTKKTPILFIHGSYHSSWCFQENWMPYFASKGYDAFALSLRGTSRSPATSSTPILIDQHINDLIDTLKKISAIRSLKPVIVGHSFGGIVIMKLLEKPTARDLVSGVALFSSVPPSGNGQMTARYIRRRFIDSLKIVWGFVFKGVNTNAQLCRELFFDETLSEQVLLKYMDNFIADSQVTTDLNDLLGKLPSKHVDSNGKAAWLADRAPALAPARLVVGSRKDFIVDIEGVEETARYLDTAPVILEDVPHDLMLGSRWQTGATILEDWCNSLQRSLDN